MKKILLVLIILLSATICYAAYSENGFTLSGNAQEGWILITPKEDYYAKWFEGELWTLWLNNETHIASCRIIRESKDYECTLQEFSIILSYYPYQQINEIKNK
jgi:hypothetical protein